MAKSEVIKLLGLDDIREFYEHTEAEKLFWVEFSLVSDDIKNNIFDNNAMTHSKQSYNSTSKNERRSYVDLRYDVGQDLTDYCTLNIRFDKNDKLIAIFYYCD